MKDMETFKKAPNFLDNPRLMGLYPQFACDTLEQLMFISDQPKKRLVGTAMAGVRNLSFMQMLKDGFNFGAHSIDHPLYANLSLKG